MKRLRSKLGKRRREIEQPEIIKIGDKVDLSKHLFTPYRNYLYSYGRNQQIPAKEVELGNKVVILLFVEPHDYIWWSQYVPHVLDMYNKLNDLVEIISVSYGDDVFFSYPNELPISGIFKLFCETPWLAIPWSDVKSRKHLRTLFGITDKCVTRSFVIDQAGVVLQSDAIRLFSKYGAAAYPFTTERIASLEREDDAAKTQPSITRLLADDDGQDFLINNKGEQVPLNSLEDKVVGLYFWAGHSEVYWDLDQVYEELSTNNERFEVVFIYAHKWLPWDDEEKMFWKTFKRMPWLAIPFGHTNRSKKLQRIFKYHHQEMAPLDDVPDPRLVIIGPQGDNFIQEYGDNMLREYGVSAYPFHLRNAYYIEIQKVKKVELQKLWDSKDFFIQENENGTKVPFSELLGQRIMVVFQKNNICPFVSMLEDLKDIYLNVKGSKDEFEVIHVHSVSAETPMPWLSRTPFDEGSYGYKLMSDLFPSNGLFAFDREGTLVRKARLPEFGEEDFPFHVYYSMEHEIVAEMLRRLDIPLDGVDADVRENLKKIELISPDSD